VIHLEVDRRILIEIKRFRLEIWALPDYVASGMR
jgi:hypothetical protein